MSKVVHPFAHRLGIIRDWRHRWFAEGPAYVDNLKAGVLLREFLFKELRGMYVGGIELERGKQLRVIIKTSRPGLIIGRSGEGSIKLRNSIAKFLQSRRLAGTPTEASGKKVSLPEIKLDIEEIRSPESSAAIVSYMVAEGLEKRLPFRRVLKSTIEKVMANRDVKGVRITLSGMLGGGSMSRTETLKKGRVPLQTIRADVEFHKERAQLPLGVIGIKVWIYKGDIFSKAAKEN